MENRLREGLKKLVSSEILFDEPMSRHSTIGIGGCADALLKVSSVESLKRVMEWAVKNSIQYCFWGNGSNTLVRDGGIRGMVIFLEDGFNQVKIEGQSPDGIIVSVGACVPSAKFVDWCMENGLSGAEFLSGVPGTIGGNVSTNAGSYGKEISDIVHEIRVLEKNSREVSLRKGALDFGTRRLKIPRSTAILSAQLILNKSTREEIKSTIEELANKRKSSQPFGVRSLGCCFKNPPRQSAGALIDDAGLKGIRVGGARVSTKHANFIVNESGAKARDVVVLMGLVKEKVKEKFGVILEPEISVIGVDEAEEGPLLSLRGVRQRRTTKQSIYMD